ncbi:unnamed protein product [Brassicogethes aeneus]|uniref:Protein zwilch n=1 Tax=Brassicogethes aeneus TaxID=1431903 RepID=A0A9P0B6Z3_BRAAE|nr:unnamed protein product [Brassicogethes aeneus]
MLFEENVHQSIFKPPTFLKQFFIDNERINLVYKRIGSVSVEEEEVIPVREKLETSNDGLDITGNPLKVDLNGDDSLGHIVKIQQRNNWTAQEAKLYPLSSNEARNVINKLIAKREHSIPIYCICNESDSRKIVILGAQHTNSDKMSCFIEILSGLSKNKMHLNFDFMKKEHFKSTKIQTKIDYLIKRKYYIYGYNLQSIELDNTFYTGCMAVEVIGKNLKEKLNGTQNMNMMLQVIVGHVTSPVHFLWQKLGHLQYYYDILNLPKSSINESTIINKESKMEEDIYKGISNLINSLEFMQKEQDTDFDLDNLRYTDFLDKIWDLLKNCEDLSTLRDCFYYFFGELAESENKFEISPSDKSNIARIVKDTLNIKITVPTLTFLQCLELLFELGLENLKNDYLAIFRHFCFASQDNILKNWNKFCNENLSDRELGRKTRTTIMQKDAMTNNEANQFKLGYLAQMHTAVELLFLVKNRIYLPEECNEVFIEKVYNEYVNTNNVKIDSNSLTNCRLEEFTFGLRSIPNLVDENSLDSCTVQMKSVINKTEITTAFNLSVLPIFPTSVFNGYDDNHKIKENFYVSKFVKVTRTN